MMVFVQARLVLLAVPKTASQALEAALGHKADLVIRNPPASKHMTVRRYRGVADALLGREISRTLETVAVIREPIDWLASWYRYRSRTDLLGSENSTDGVSFEAFLTAHLRTRPPPYAKVGRQSSFLRGSDGHCGVDHLFAYERLDVLQSFLEARLGSPVLLTRRNASPLQPCVCAPEPVLQRVRGKLLEDVSLHAHALRTSGIKSASRD